jgi:thiol:disulfide interchange protein DsbD
LRIVIAILSMLFFSFSFANESLQPLPAEQAFVFSVKADKSNQLILQWKMAPDYYLYRDKILVTSGPGNQVNLQPILLPMGINKKDDIRGNYQIYSNSLQVVVPFTLRKQGVVDLMIHYQGCSSKGFCYTPIAKSLVIKMNENHSSEDLTPFVSGMPSVHAYVPSEQENIQNILAGKSIFIVILSFLGLGLLLAFTPCVLPMIPILSGIIMGHRKKKLTTGKSFSLSLAYVLGMAITYAIAGVIVAMIGSHIQTEFQRPWVIAIFSGFFVLLALSLFDVYQLRLPSRWQRRLTEWSNDQKSGTYFGVFCMGSISSLIASPCITPPLVGVLAYIAQTGDKLLGALALLALGLGMGIPLLLIGVSAGKLLPKAGPWMITLERIMGWMMLAFAIWMISRVIPGPATLFLWSFWLVGIAIFSGAFSKKKPDKFLLRKGLGIVIFVYAIILMVGALLGNSNPLNPWENGKFNHVKAEAQPNVAFVTLTSLKQLDDLLLVAKQQKKPVLIDFYADWCESCIRMERYVLKRPDVQSMLTKFMVLRADVTVNNTFDQAMMARFHVIAPPTLVFFDKEGEALINEQLIGEVDATTLLMHLSRIEAKGVDRAN